VLPSLQVYATPTGLNNIPTADVTPERTLVLQAFGNFEDDSRPDAWTGFKYGLLRNLEIGFDGQLNPEPSDSGILAAQADYRIALSDAAALGVGIANLGDKSRSGEVDYYTVFSHDLRYLRLHLGGTLQHNNEGVFAGLDTDLFHFEREFRLRTDIRQTNERDDVLVSAGFICDLGFDVLLESWGSFPSESDGEDVLTVKFNYVVSL